MKEINNLTFTLEEDNQKVEYDTVLTFYNKDNKKNYIVYTDNTLDEEGNLKTFASIYNPENSELELLPIETEEEWDNIESVLKNYLGGNK